tara:strand:+ start:5941 stop:6354 length:414 start_codon:yes stop_codon:yes gene_type:complete
LVLKDKERFILKRLNRFFLSDVLKESKYEYNRYDAENDKYIVEIKHRDKFYTDTMIEFDKFSYNILYAKMTKKFFIYVVRMNNNIYVLNITKLVQEGYNFNWEFKDMPKQTEFANNKEIKKLVGYININKSVKEFKV